MTHAVTSITIPAARVTNATDGVSHPAGAPTHRRTCVASVCQCTDGRQRHLPTGCAFYYHISAQNLLGSLKTAMGGGLD